ncbi:MAG: succinate-semialdehyde dehydrogenase [Halobacteriovoraceae bacterium]|nr:succinate-semialdehyde dehydrogenase [Halobacteriovoraceae bacterium]|tara:strand:+ start:25667 stop:27025 length:1359 start_codon:yes stop_codon:yes gene_type:complete
MKSINPHDGELIREYKEYSDAMIEQTLSEVHSTNKLWSHTGFTGRSKLFKELAHVLRHEKLEYAELMAEEMGKPMKEGVAEIEKCAWVCDYYADNAKEFLAPKKIEADVRDSHVRFDPMGTILAIMPWNFPFWQVFRFAAPTLMAGNTAVLKHASNVSGCALAIEELFKTAGFPNNVFRTLLVSGKKIGEVVKDDRIAAVTLTGSAPAGIAAGTSAAEKIKKVVLELGGSDPYIVFEDADLDQAVDSIATSRMINSGQSCIAAKRFFVHSKIKEDFTKALKKRFEHTTMGDPTVEGNMIGPQAKMDLRDQLHDQVQKSVEKGATLLLGGEIPDLEGSYYPPTLLTDVKKGMPAFDEEMFGPVGAIIEFTSDDEALEMANDSEFGLGSAIFTKDHERIERFVRELQAGSVFVNHFVKSDPRLPFGGIKNSGHGRELADFGIHEFVNIKTVSMK